ncbi:unnamed protein product [Ambrosiozyma monospora]|uniref:Unnamed protein product n=1 Tax=Ambrosiozyma monospora TaxID=43982 RepID=A0ACB5SRJ5_AMBMO|nr:unnamed protein product [Ambrosiozyma monospora]
MIFCILSSSQHGAIPGLTAPNSISGETNSSVSILSSTTTLTSSTMDSRIFEFTMRDAPNHAATIGELVADCDAARWCTKFIKRLQVIAPNAFDAQGKMHTWANTDGYLRRIAAEIIIESIKMGSGYTEDDMKATSLFSTT